MDRDITFNDYLRVAWSGRWLILVTTALGIIVGILVSVSHAGAYSATSRVFLGQAVSSQGVPLQTPLGTSLTVAGSVDITAAATAAAQQLGLPASEVVGHVHVSALLPVTAPSNALGVLLVTASNARPARAIQLANQTAQILVSQSSTNFAGEQQALEAQISQGKAEVARLTRQVNGLTAHGGAGAAVADGALLATVQSNLATAEISLAKYQQAEAPTVLVKAYRAATANPNSKRLQSIVLAGLVGFILGLIATFIWRGSPGARAAQS